jgi:hypothetical protein
MKIILSRKGFDAGAGGVPSPIMPEGQLLSLPIPEGPPILPDSQSLLSYVQISPRMGKLGKDLAKGRVGPHQEAHFDPDLVSEARERGHGWKAIFGQAHAAQSVLERQGVGTGDLFLFFGWFKKVLLKDGIYCYVRGAEDLHVIWGWMQVGEIYRIGEDTARIPEWARYHPHVIRPNARPSNTIYVAADRLNIGGKSVVTPAAGVFPSFHERLRLTAPGAARSTWSLPAWFYPAPGREPLGYHRSLDRWMPEDDRVRLRTVGRGQEFVLDANYYPEAIQWVQDLLGGDTV